MFRILLDEWLKLLHTCCWSTYRLMHYSSIRIVPVRLVPHVDLCWILGGSQQNIRGSVPKSHHLVGVCFSRHRLGPRQTWATKHSQGLTMWDFSNSRMAFIRWEASCANINFLSLWCFLCTNIALKWQVRCVSTGSYGTVWCIKSYIGGVKLFRGL